MAVSYLLLPATSYQLTAGEQVPIPESEECLLVDTSVRSEPAGIPGRQNREARRLDRKRARGYPPRVIHIDDRRVEVKEVLDSRLAPDHRYFKVRGDDGDAYIVRHDLIADSWDLTMFKRTTT